MTKNKKSWKWNAVEMSNVPEYVRSNYEAMLDRINESNMDESRKMLYRQFMGTSIESTNGRTIEQKIQDLTVNGANLLMLTITRQLDSECRNQDIKDDISTLKTDISKLKNDVSAIDKKVDALQEDLKINDEVTQNLSIRLADPDTEKPSDPKWQVVLRMISKSWPLCVTIIGVTMVLAFKPTLIQFAEKFFGL